MRTWYGGLCEHIVNRLLPAWWPETGHNYYLITPGQVSELQNYNLITLVISDNYISQTQLHTTIRSMDRLISISDGANLSGLYAAVPHENEHFPSVSPVSSCTGSCNKSKLNDTTVVTVQMGQMQADPGNPLLIFSSQTNFVSTLLTVVTGWLPVWKCRIIGFSI